MPDTSSPRPPPPPHLRAWWRAGALLWRQWEALSLRGARQLDDRQAAEEAAVGQLPPQSGPDTAAAGQLYVPPGFKLLQPQARGELVALLAEAGAMEQRLAAFNDGRRAPGQQMTGWPAAAGAPGQQQESI